MALSRDSDGWTILEPNGDLAGSSTTDTKIAYVSDSVGDNEFNGRNPFFCTFSNI